MTLSIRLWAATLICSPLVAPGAQGGASDGLRWGGYNPFGQSASSPEYDVDHTGPLQADAAKRERRMSFVGMD